MGPHSPHCWIAVFASLKDLWWKSCFLHMRSRNPYASWLIHFTLGWHDMTWQTACRNHFFGIPMNQPEIRGHISVKGSNLPRNCFRSSAHTMRTGFRVRASSSGVFAGEAVRGENWSKPTTGDSEFASICTAFKAWDWAAFASRRSRAMDPWSMMPENSISFGRILAEQGAGR